MKYSKLLLLLSLAGALTSCYKHDSRTTTPNWPNKARIGRYCTHDTQVIFSHDLTKGWFDTIASSFTITVTAARPDSLIFDTVITWGGNWPEGFRYYDDCSRFAYISTNYYYNMTGNGQFNSDTLIYSWRILPMPTTGGVVSRWGTGIRYTATP